MAAIGKGIDGGDANTAVTGGVLSPEVMTYYEKVFLARAKYELVMKEGAQTRTHATGQGRTVNFTRRNPLTVITSPLGEASNPITCPINASTVAMTLSEYGLTTTVSRLGTLVGIDSGLKETVEQMGQNMGETLDQLTRVELQNGTSYYGNNHLVDTFTAGDTLDACDIRMMVRQLELNKAMIYKDGFYIGKTDPYSKFNLIGDTTWVNAHTYKDGDALYQGEIGKLYQVRFLVNKNVASGTEATSTASSGVVRFYTFVHGQESFGVYDLAQDQPKLYILPNVVDSNSPVGRLSWVSWAGTFATKLLNSNWVISGRFASV